jgi:hypothetical protein
MAVRDNLHPAGKEFFSLSDSTYSLKLSRWHLGENLQLKFMYAKGKEELTVVKLPPLPSGWSAVELKWDQTGCLIRSNRLSGSQLACRRIAAYR